MKNSIATSLTFLITIFFLNTQAHAWGKTGHRIVGEVAQKQLTLAAQKKVKALIGNESLAEASTWADEVRSNPDHNFQNPWHYTSVEDGGTYNGPSDPSRGDVVTAIKEMIAILKGETTNPQVSKKQALRLLVHFVGDIHQPLHAGRASDAGGNRILVKYFKKEIVNLHELWDEKIVMQQEFSYTEYADRLLRKFQAGSWKKDPVETWTNESVSLRARVYETNTSFIDPRTPIKLISHEAFLQKYPNAWSKNHADVDALDPLTLTGVPEVGYQYIFRNLPILEERLYKAGVRLAYILNNEI